MCMYIHVCMHVCMYVCVYVCMYVCIYIYIYIYDKVDASPPAKGITTAAPSRSLIVIVSMNTYHHYSSLSIYTIIKI